MSEIVICGGTIINRGRSFVGYVRVSGERIVEVGEGEFREELSNAACGKSAVCELIDARGMIVMPGVIDDQVHFREPGMTYKGDIHSESVAGVAGGVTSFMEMPNTKPATVTLDLLEQKHEIAAQSSVANYSFYLGATTDNIKEITRLNPRTTCGVKLFMGSSTGNMLVDDDRALAAIFAESPILIATHCEQESIVRQNTELYKSKYGDAVTPSMHPLIRSAEACYRSSARAVELADRYGSNLHILHLSTASELSLFDSKPLSQKRITNEVCVHHLWFSDEDYLTKGNFIKWNPAIKTAADRAALQAALLSGKVDVVATDHAPHSLEEKQLPYWNCPSGGPMLQHSLVAMLELAVQGVLSFEQVVEKMCHAPAERFGVVDRGFLEAGSYADIAIVRTNSPWTVDRSNILYKCGWSPMEGVTFSNQVAYTIINGVVVKRGTQINREFRAKPLQFK